MSSGRGRRGGRRYAMEFVKLDVSVNSAVRHCCVTVFTISVDAQLSKGGEQGEGCSDRNPETRKGSDSNHLMSGCFHESKRRNSSVRVRMAVKGMFGSLCV